MSAPGPHSMPTPSRSGLGVAHLTGYSDRRDWSDAYEASVMNIIARFVLRKGTWTEDVTKGADPKERSQKHRRKG